MKEGRRRGKAERRDRRSAGPKARKASKDAAESFLTFVPKKQVVTKRQEEEKRREKKRIRAATKNRRPAAKRASSSGRNVRSLRRRRGQKRDGGSAIDVAVGLTGVLVLLFAVVTVGIYSGVRQVNRQAAAMAEIGKKMEAIGVAGEGVFTAVADAQIAAREAAQLEDTKEAEYVEKEYEEKELIRDVEIALKLSSIQKDMKIKFTNRESGKLIGNQPFEVKIEGPESRTERDGDEDGIISISGIAPGEYTVTILSPDEVEGSAAAGVSGKVTVKDEIVYEKVDVSDEVKKESEINAAKEDTEIQTQVESVLTDTVEWVESTRTPLDGGGWEEVPKEKIPVPGGLAGLSQAALQPIAAGAWFSKEETAESEPQAESDAPSEEGETAETDGASGEASDEFNVTGVRISGGGDYVVGETVALRAEADTAGEGELTEEDYQWSGDVSGAGPSLSVSSDQEATLRVTVTVKGVSAETEVAFRTPESESEEEENEEEENEDGSAPLKDGDGNALYYKDGEEYKAATAADYDRYDVFYRKKEGGEYRYTGWQTIDGKRYYFDRNGDPVTGEQVILGMKYVFLEDGSLQVNGVMGIDVSRHNGSIDWNAVKNSGVEFVIIRCGYRGSSTGVLVEDEMFRKNIQGAAAAGLKVGVYVFSQAINEAEAIEEASMAVSAVSGYSLSYPIFIDVEGANGRADGLSREERTAVIRSFCQTVANSGYTPGIYSNRTWLAEKIDTGALGSYKIWMAQYAATPTYSGRYEMWQYSSRGSIPGILGDVDLNISYLAY